MSNDISSGVSFKSICFDAITHYWQILVRNINTVRGGSPKYSLCQAMGASQGRLQEAPHWSITITDQVTDNRTFLCNIIDGPHRV